RLGADRAIPADLHVRAQNGACPDMAAATHGGMLADNGERLDDNARLEPCRRMNDRLRADAVPDDIGRGPHRLGMQQRAGTRESDMVISRYQDYNMRRNQLCQLLRANDRRGIAGFEFGAALAAQDITDVALDAAIDRGDRSYQSVGRGTI